MGMTDNENPIGLVPFLNPGFGIGAFGKRRKRSTVDPDIGAEKIAGGERYVAAHFRWIVVGMKKMCKKYDLQIGTFDYTQLGFQFLDFQLKSFMHPKPVELGESAIYQKFCLNKLVWLQK